MASAVLTSRNEPHWAEHKPYMTKYTTPHSQLNSRFNPNPSPSPNFSSRQVQNVSALSHLRQGNVPSHRAAQPPPPPATAEQNAVNDRNDSFRREYVTYNLASYSRRELKELKKRLISDLDRVRGLQNRIEAKEFVSRPNFHPSHYREGAHLSTAPHDPAFETIPPNVSRVYQNHESFGGKSKNKNKLLSGQKRAATFGTGGDPKRPVVVEDYQMDKAVVGMMRRCKQILTKLMKHKHGWVFNTPVDVNALGLDDYYDIIKYPMDLGTVKLRLDKNEYRTPQDFAADVRLTFNNAMTYNPKGQDVHALAQLLLDNFEEMFRPAYKKYEAEQRKVDSTKQRNQSQPEPVVMPNALPEPMPVAKISDSVRSHSTALNHHKFPVRDLSAPVSVPPASKSPPRPVTPRSTKLPKPKAQDLSKRPMEFEEKVKLGTSLQNLPPDKMDHVVHIVKMRNPNLAQEGDEIELDFEALDNETLWELDRFVSYHKKAASKMKRQGISEDAAVAAEQLIKNSPEVAPIPIPEHTMPRNKKGDVGEEDVDIGEDIPVDNFPPVQIEKDVPSNSSSSSSSGSDSSSSDSESGSSSGSDSDEHSVQSPYVEANVDPTT